DRNRSHWSTSKTPSYTKSVSWQHHPMQLSSIMTVMSFPVTYPFLPACSATSVLLFTQHSSRKNSMIASSISY
ncbi:transposase, partial [Acinetobacter nosocomialis]